MADPDLHAAPAGVCRIDDADIVVSATPAFLRLTGVAEGGIAGRPVSTLVHPDDNSGLMSAIRRARAGHAEADGIEVRFLCDGAEPRWMTVSIAWLPAKAGTSSCVILQIQSVDRLMRRLSSLQKNETRWQYALESALQGVWDHDFNSGEMFYSATWRKLRGLDPDCEVDGTLETWIESVHPDDRLHVLEYIRRQDEGEVEFNTFQYRERHADGHWVWIESRGASIEWGADGKPTRIIGTDTDITARKQAEETLEEISRKLRLALDVSRIGVFDFNLTTGETVWDERMMQIYGLDRPDSCYLPTDWEALLHPDDRERALGNVSASVAAGTPFTNAFRIVRQDGAICHIRSNAAPYAGHDGALKLIGANWDVTADLALQEDLARANRLAEARNEQLEAARVHIEYNALHDHLTGLPNRRFLDQQLDNWMARTASRSAILHIDLDRFKQINDTLGHKAGDVMLVHTATMLTSLVGKDDFVARIGGDEFVILCAAQRTRSEVIALTDAIIATLRQPVRYEGHLCRFGASVGIALTSDGNADARQSLMNADIALYRAKGLGRNRYEFFTKQLETQIHHVKRTADEIMKGLEDREFIPFYQPQFCARSLDITGVETLARWAHPVRGLLAPDYFLKIAEDISTLAAIDRSIAEQALADFQAWKRMGLVVPRLSVNVSSRRLREPDLIETLKSLDIPPGILSFELLESIFLDEFEDSVAQTIAALKALGIDIEIDDFGTGHASIVGLLKLSPSRLKIDRALVKPISHSQEQRRLVRSIIDIGHSLRIEVVAEGVETMAHAEILRDLGCDILQGYAFAKPMSSTDIMRFVSAQSWRRPRAPVRALQRTLRKDFGT